MFLTAGCDTPDSHPTTEPVGSVCFNVDASVSSMYEELKRIGKEPGDTFEATIAFGADSVESAARLTDTLGRRGNLVGYGENHAELRVSSSTYFVSGRSTPLTVDREYLMGWASSICEISREHDSVFESWAIFVVRI
jgi:hypothetical protein